MTTLVWFRDDLRTADHPALLDAAGHGDVVCLYVLDERSDGVRPLGGAARWWLHHSIERLREDLARLGARLILRRGPAAVVVPRVFEECGADRVVWNRRYGGAEREIDAGLKRRFGADGREVHSFAASLLFEPWEIVTGQGTPYKVFTPFWKAALAAREPRHPVTEPETLSDASSSLSSDDLADWSLLPRRPDWSGGLAETWQPGQAAAHERLEDFLDDSVSSYREDRDFPALPATSGLSPHLRWGEISPHQVWHAARNSGRDVGTFLSELGWREFAWHTLYRHPDLATVNLDRRFDAFAWADPDPDEVQAWQMGRTGIPLVDAGMRELWRTGTMHNRVRMVAASFLVKNLRIDWRRGEQWFWDTLVDADAASNPFNWQWVAGCGADAAPYFRIFNPLTQAKKFDPDGTYVRRWLGGDTGDNDGMDSTQDPVAEQPIVDLKASREAALAAFEEIKRP